MRVGRCARRPSSTRVWGNHDHVKSFRDAARGGREWITLPEHFKRRGYTVLGAGKIFHPDFTHASGVQGPRLPFTRPTPDYVYASCPGGDETTWCVANMCTSGRPSTNRLTCTCHVPPCHTTHPVAVEGAWATRRGSPTSRWRSTPWTTCARWPGTGPPPFTSWRASSCRTSRGACAMPPSLPFQPQPAQRLHLGPPQPPSADPLASRPPRRTGPAVGLGQVLAGRFARTGGDLATQHGKRDVVDVQPAGCRVRWLRDAE